MSLHYNRGSPGNTGQQDFDDHQSDTSGCFYPRAEDVINSLIAVYNEEAINDKNQITVNTSEFYNERLIIIERIWAMNGYGYRDINARTN